ncbi:hypothetical protein AGMMS50229_02720 [Campylobacterota bacterium]|nr:hypothetical protein AGMMS50229_02720 [Campylobacterota bacterium]
MTLLDSRKIILKSIAEELNRGYFSLYERLENAQTCTIDARAIKNELEGLENMMSYVRSEAESIGRDAVHEAASEVAALWQGYCR